MELELLCSDAEQSRGYPLKIDYVLEERRWVIDFVHYGLSRELAGKESSIVDRFGD
jgi:hypothetical protein